MVVQRRKAKTRVAILLAVVATAAGIVLYVVHVRRTAPPAVAGPTTAPAENPPVATTPAVVPTRPAAVETSFMDVVRAEVPSLPTTQPLPVPVELSQAAHFVLSDPVYLSNVRGDLWITRPRAAPIKQVLHEAADPNSDSQVHIVHEEAAFVHWMADNEGNWSPYLVCRGGPTGYELVWAEGRRPFPTARVFLWDRAFSWDDKIVVPIRSGLCVIEITPQIKESYYDLTHSSGGTSAPATRRSELDSPQVLPDGDGLLVWVPWENGREGSRGAARYLNGRWTPLGPDQGWPEKLVHLVPLRDGTVFQFYRRDDGSITVQSMSLQPAPVDEQAIRKRIDQLDDPDPDVRRQAFVDLSNFGPGAWPVLEKLSGDQPPQAKMLLRQLLKDRARPTLSGMTLLGGRSLELAARLSDGGVVFYAPQGVSLPEADGQETTTAPAWLSIRPGHYIELLPPILVADLKPGQSVLDVVNDRWIVDSDVRGPRLFYGNGFATLLRKDERQFARVVGMDQRGRWLFREPNRSDAERPQTLIIDPHLPDLTPRLPVWQLAIAHSVGWDKDNWPVLENVGEFALTETGWRPLDKDEKFFTRPDQLPPASPEAVAPATGPATRPATGPSEPPILVTSEGDRFYGGLTDLRVVKRDGREIDWPLPAIDSGSGPVCLIRTSDGKFFLFNQPGRVLRLVPTPGGAEPFKVDASFTHKIPTIANPTRIWLDPAGRIDIEWENQLAILFPQGYIPTAISRLMPDQSGLDAENP